MNYLRGIGNVLCNLFITLKHVQLNSQDILLDFEFISLEGTNGGTLYIFI